MNRNLQKLIDCYYGPIFDGEAKVTVHYNSTGPDASTTPETPTTPTVASFGDVPAGAWYAAAGSFTDVPVDADYAAAVAWAAENGVTFGTSDTTFSPDDICNRGHIVTFLQRAFDK